MVKIKIGKIAYYFPSKKDLLQFIEATHHQILYTDFLLEMYSPKDCNTFNFDKFGGEFVWGVQQFRYI